jgi:glucosamine--fructose-6-phosphate aminotransferase (isomerizing)|tara:strand:+ start:269 stop:2608 length:2340 start_codon:yes stop_codon:yes gene_type:complete
MCGIFAYLNCGVPKTRKEIVEKLLVGLKRLEYRGYDSAGFAVDESDEEGDEDAQNGRGRARKEKKGVVVCKEVGKIANLEALARKELFGEDEEEEDEEKEKEEDGILNSNAKSNETTTKSSNRSNGKKRNASIKPLDFCASIAHTRWATHGPPNRINTHPHTSDSRENEFVVVHNGIITNHAPLRAMLERRGVKFETQTDTEVIPKLCKFLSDKFEESGEKDVTFRQLAMEVTRQLQGAYALVFKSTKYPGELVAAKRGSPLLMGISDDSGEVSGVIEGGLSDGGEDDILHKKTIGGSSKKRKSMTGAAADTVTTTTANSSKVEFYFASDASAMVEHTKRVLVLEDDDVCHCHDGTYKIYKVEKQKHSQHPGYTSGHDSPEYGLYKPVVMSKEVERTIETLEMEVESIMKGEFDHFMQKEIFEQPEAISSTMRGRLVLDVLGAAERVMLGGMSQFAATIRRSRRIILCGCGTSYNSAIAIRQLFEELTELPVTLELASDVLDRRCPFFRDDTCVFISQSGETADTLKALEYAKAKGALCVGIVNTVGSAISRATDCGVHINAGAEIGVASTKAYTCQIVAMVLVALSLSEDSRSKHARRDDIMQGLLKLPGCVKGCLKMDAKLLELAQELKDEHSLLIFGRGFNYATALEGALKVKEVALVHSEGILAGEMKHGPLALVDKHMPIIVVCTNDGSYEKQQSVVQQLKARDGRLILIVSEDDKEMEKTAPDAVILRVPKVEDCLQAVVNIIPLQLLSYHLTILRGHNCDQPRNLAKSVTVE